MSTAVVPLRLVGTDGVTVEVVPSAIERRDSAVGWAEILTEVTTPEKRVLADDARRDLKAIEKSVESARTEVKAPVLEIGRKIDAAARDFLDPVIAQGIRLGALVDEFVAEGRRKAAEEAARIAEEQRKAKAIEDARIAEQRRLEEAARVANLPPPPPLPTAPAVVIQAPAVVEQPRPSGSVEREVWEFEVLDIAALYAARPELCKIDARTADINRVIASGARDIPGLRIFSQLKTGVRA